MVGGRRDPPPTFLWVASGRLDRGGAGMISVPISLGELFDRISILEIKCERLARPEQRYNATRELELLRAQMREHGVGRGIQPLYAELRRVNETLWDIEDAIRDCERRQAFGPEFVQLAREVYLNNDRRAAIKRHINELSGSELREEKSYTAY